MCELDYFVNNQKSKSLSSWNLHSQIVRNCLFKWSIKSTSLETRAPLCPSHKSCFNWTSRAKTLTDLWRPRCLQQKMSAFYAVARGKTVGIFLSWSECEQQVRGFKGAVYKKFSTRKEAEDFIAEKSAQAPVSGATVAEENRTTGVCIVRLKQFILWMPMYGFLLMIGLNLWHTLCLVMIYD